MTANLSATPESAIPTKPKNWTSQAIKALTGPKLYGVAQCLYIRVSESGAKHWVFRWRSDGTLRDMGIGSFGRGVGKGEDEIGLAEARDLARKYRKQVKDGGNPITERKKLKAEQKAAAGKIPTFTQAVTKYISLHKAGWKNPKHVAQWQSTLTTYAGPVIGDLYVNEITEDHIIKILETIWVTKTETASRLRGRLERVLDWATARKYREGLNPARWKGNLDASFPKPSDLKKVTHHKSLPYPEIHGFIKELDKQSGVAAAAIKFTILTAARTGETIGAKWSEIDFDAAVWTVPPERMKARKNSNKPHKVPLSAAAIKVLKGQQGQDETFVFPGIQEGKHMSNMAMLELLKGLKKDFTVHGFRSAFRTWAAEQTNFPRQVCEMALAHVNKDKVEDAYLDSDLLEKRVPLMDQWAKHCSRAPPKDNVVAITEAKS